MTEKDAKDFMDSIQDATKSVHKMMDFSEKMLESVKAEASEKDLHKFQSQFDMLAEQMNIAKSQRDKLNEKLKDAAFS